VSDDGEDSGTLTPKEGNSGNATQWLTTNRSTIENDNAGADESIMRRDTFSTHEVIVHNVNKKVPSNLSNHPIPDHMGEGREVRAMSELIVSHTMMDPSNWDPGSLETWGHYKGWSCSTLWAGGTAHSVVKLIPLVTIYILSFLLTRRVRKKAGQIDPDNDRLGWR
jgi:hypothetical protein